MPPLVEWRSRCIEGSAVFTMLTSRRVMKPAVRVTASAFHRRGSGTNCVMSNSGSSWPSSTGRNPRNTFQFADQHGTNLDRVVVEREDGLPLLADELQVHRGLALVCQQRRLQLADHGLVDPFGHREQDERLLLS